MRKFFVFAAAIAFAAFTVTACGGSSAPADQTEAAEDSPNKALLDEFETMVTDLQAAIDSAQNGDLAAKKKAADLGLASSKWLMNNSMKVMDMTAAERDRFAELTNRQAEVVKKWTEAQQAELEKLKKK